MYIRELKSVLQMGFPDFDIPAGDSFNINGKDPPGTQIGPSETYSEDHTIHKELRLLLPGLQPSLLLLGICEDVPENHDNWDSDNFEWPRDTEGDSDLGDNPVLPLPIILNETDPDNSDK